jgi:hypothetical protein
MTRSAYWFTIAPSLLWDAYSCRASTNARHTRMTSSSFLPMRRLRISFRPASASNDHLPSLPTIGIGEGRPLVPVLHRVLGLDQVLDPGLEDRLQRGDVVVRRGDDDVLDLGLIWVRGRYPEPRPLPGLGFLLRLLELPGLGHREGLRGGERPDFDPGE